MNLEDTVSIVLVAVILWTMVEAISRSSPRDTFLLVVLFRWFIAIGVGIASLAHLIFFREPAGDDATGRDDRFFVAFVFFPLAALLFVTMYETGIFLGMALRASRMPNETLDILPDHWFDRRLQRFIRRRLGLSRVLDLVFRTKSHPRLIEQLKLGP